MTRSQQSLSIGAGEARTLRRNAGSEQDCERDDKRGSEGRRFYVYTQEPKGSLMCDYRTEEQSTRTPTAYIFYWLGTSAASGLRIETGEQRSSKRTLPHIHVYGRLVGIRRSSDGSRHNEHYREQRYSPCSRTVPAGKRGAGELTSTRGQGQTALGRNLTVRVVSYEASAAD